MDDDVRSGAAARRLGASRRRILAAALGAIGAATITHDTAVLSQDATPGAGDTVSLLVVQPGSEGHAVRSPGDPARYTLELVQQGGISLYFSDRPERIAGLIQTADLLAEPGLFGSDPPNAALAFQDVAGGPGMGLATLELDSGAFDPVTNTVTYQATILPIDDLAAAEIPDSVEPVEALPESFGHAWLFIDGINTSFEPKEGMAIPVEGGFIR